QKTSATRKRTQITRERTSIARERASIPRERASIARDRASIACERTSIARERTSIARKRTSATRGGHQQHDGRRQQRAGARPPGVSELLGVGRGPFASTCSICFCCRRCTTAAAGVGRARACAASGDPADVRAVAAALLGGVKGPIGGAEQFFAGLDVVWR